MRGKTIRGSALPGFELSNAATRPARAPARPAGQVQGRAFGSAFGSLGGSPRIVTPADVEKAELFRQAVNRGSDEARARTEIEVALMADESFLRSLGF